MLPLKQSAGAPTVPKVQAGDKVKTGQIIGEVPAGALGAILHAPFAGTVTAVSADAISLTRIA